jgi:UDP-N-acetylmuramoyl-tripeptide--D-alanyl-D-alanine ligase
MAQNALAATAAAHALGIGVGESAERLADAELSPGRMEVRETPDGIRIVNDAYNANPSSMVAALKTARWMAGEGRLIAVVGAMAELGAVSAAEHERIGELAARLRIDRLIVVGKEARLIAIGATREGVEPDRVTVCDTLDEAVSAVRALAGPGDVVLIKASRVVGLDRIADSLLAPVGAAPASRSTVPSAEVPPGGTA